MDAQVELLIRNVWLLMCTGLVFFMQAGFCCLEAGAVRHKNSVNVALKNVVDFLVASFCFYMVGYALMFGTGGQTGWWGKPVFFLQGLTDADSIPFLYQLVFCGTAATIVSGAMAERLRFLPYILGSAALSLIVYPLWGHWVWNSEGWLRRLGFHDFAGSSAVHMVGGMVSLAGIIHLGPRLGRFGKDGEVRDVHASDVPMVALGTFILFFGWIGFNGGSAPFGAETGTIVLNTILGGVFGGLSCLLFGWAFQGISGASTIMNGILAGLVAITASADCVTPAAASLIGAAGGLTYFLCDKWLLKLRVDDAVSAVPVHGASGLIGILLTGVFMKQSSLEAANASLGLELNRLALIKVQAFGAFVCMAWCLILGFLIWWIIGRISPLRVTSDEESVGLNYSEHQVKSPVDEMVGYMRARASQSEEAVRPQESDAGELARLMSVIDEWSRQIEKDRDEIEQVRGWLNQDADQIYTLIQKCHEENQHQAQRLEAVARKIERVERELRQPAGQQTQTRELAEEVLENVREKLVEMQTGGQHMTYYWEQLRNLGSSLFRNTRTLVAKQPGLAQSATPNGFKG
jgi:ammonium transporter, Amt family